jgi:hypothetical protein
LGSNKGKLQHATTVCESAIDGYELWCFLPHENNNLSATDKTLIAETYPQDTTKQAALLEARQEQVLSKIKDSRSDAKLTEAQIKEFSKCGHYGNLQIEHCCST